MATDLLDYRVTAGRSHGPPAAFDAQRNAHQTYYVLAGDTPVLVHNDGGDLGYVYLRVDTVTGEQYVGQAMNTQRYDERQDEHRRANRNAKYEFHILGRAPAGVQLDVLEESWIRAGGGPKTVRNPNGTLINKRFQMSDIRYLAAGGDVCR